MKSYLVLFSLFFTSCSHSKDVFIHIPEASGICYAKSSNSLFVANDEGTIYELSTSGKLLRKKRLGDYNLEGVACDDDKGKLYFAVEGSDNILIVNQKNLTRQKEINIKREFKKIKILKKDKKHGLEAITIIDGNLYLSNQSTKPFPKPDSSVIIKVGSIEKRKTVIKEIINHGYFDIAGLCYHEGYLYMVSDRDDMLIKYDIKNKKTIASKKLPLGSWEGVTFDNDGFIYLADDDGKVIKQSFKGFM